MFKIKIGLDWDDVVAPFNSIAINMANEKYPERFKTPLTLEDIDSWENTGRASVIHEFYGKTELYERQAVSIPQKNIDAVRELEKFADVYFITAVYQPFMSMRAKLIQETFPELGPERIILGAAKSLVRFDVILDDNICNVLDSKADYPVLMRKPWNKQMTGLLSVNNLEEFVSLTKHIIGKDTEIDTKKPRVIALVGPSGSGKNKIADELSALEGYETVRGYSTKENSGRYTYIPPKEFAKRSFFEHTYYAGYEYGTSYEEIVAILQRGHNVVLVLDMCGAIGMKMRFPTTIVYVKRNKVELVRAILEDDVDTEEKTLRLLSIETEKKNEDLCDMTAGSAEEIANAECIKVA